MKHLGNKGITLIVLVITIIVMLILVGVTINLSLNGELFGYAKQATKETEKAKQDEINLSGGTINGQTIDEIVNGTNAYTAYQKAEKNADGTLKENITYIENGKTAVIPKGFAVSNVKGEQTIEKGLVIQDSQGNEFVWIPVEVTQEDKEEEIKLFYRSHWEDDEEKGGKRGEDIMKSTKWVEPYIGGYEGEEADYKDMLKSVYRNKGFYIGRYEAGSIEERTETGKNEDKGNGTTTMVVQKGVYPYNYVGWGLTNSDYMKDVLDSEGKNQGKGALKLCKEFYPTDENDENYKGEVGVICTLCYGIQWDAMLDFIKDKNHPVCGDLQWGNHSYPVLKTGSNDAWCAKNIYDVEGNVMERTMEMCTTSDRRVARGSSCLKWAVSYVAADRRLPKPDGCLDNLGFRPVLYITNN